MTVKNTEYKNTNTKYKTAHTAVTSKALLDDHYTGILSTQQFLHSLSAVIAESDEEITVITRHRGKRLIQTTDPIVIADITTSDAEIVAKEYDTNGFVCKLRALVTDNEMRYLTEVER